MPSQKEFRDVRAVTSVLASRNGSDTIPLDPRNAVDAFGSARMLAMPFSYNKV
jgi:hypothetical protein